MMLPPPEIFAARAARLRDLLAAGALDALIITSLPNIAYLTGLFASAAALVVTADAMLLMSDSRYGDTLDARARDWPAIRAIQLSPGASYDEAVVEAIQPLRGSSVGFEASHLTVRRHLFITKRLAAGGWQTLPKDTDGLVEQLRVTKDVWEVATLREGAARLSDVANYIISQDLAGRTEWDVAAEIERRLRHVGFERPSFDTIVAAGPNAARPHARAGDRRIADGDLVVLDFGGVFRGYCTDLTRTVTAGRGGDDEHRLIARVAEAQEAAFRALAPGRAPECVDDAAREVLGRYGLAEAFTHGTGHGLGLEVHEAPRITRRRPATAEPPLAAGMVLTLEPGVYYPGRGGVRIEDDVLVTEGGAEWLTDAPSAVRNA